MAQKIVTAISSTMAGGSASVGDPTWLPADVDKEVPRLNETSCALAVSSVSEGSAQGRESGPSECAAAVPFDLAFDFLVVVNGGVGNLDGLRFIVDTGSTWSAIDEKVAERLG